MLGYIQKRYRKNLPCVFFEKRYCIYKNPIYKNSKNLNYKKWVYDMKK